MKPVLSRKRTSPTQIGVNNVPETASDARCTQIPPTVHYVDEATSRIFANMFTAYRLNHCAYKSKSFILKSLSAEYSRHECIIRDEEKSKCSLSSKIPSNLYDDDDTASYVSSDVSDMTMPESSSQRVFCRISEPLLDWIFNFLPCADDTEVEYCDQLSSFH